MILKIAWKNIWRSKVRSMVLIFAVVIGVWSLAFLLGWVKGITQSFIDQAVDHRLSHIQIHHPNFSEDRNLEYFFAEEDVRMSLDSMPLSFTSRILCGGMINSPRSARGVLFIGVNPQQEAEVTKFKNMVREGTYFESKGRNPILVSTSLAEKLGVKLRSKVVASFQNIHGQIASASFRIVGIFESGDIKIDDFSAFVLKDDLQRLTEVPDGSVHEIAILLENDEQLERQKSQIASNNSTLKVETYKELAPDVELMSSQIQINIVIMTIIFMLALIFGIINTMLMAVLERTRELGMLMAIGMNKIRVFTMVMIETIMLSMVGVPIGLGLGWFTVDRMNHSGINLSNWSDGLKQFGMKHIVYPEIDWVTLAWIGLAVAITSFLAAIYPSWKAIKLKPVSALRKI